MNNAGNIVIYCTCPNEETADRISNALLEKKQIACANIIPQVISKYWWKGNIEKDSEVFMIMKSKKVLFEDIVQTVRIHHPYETPEIISHDIVRGNEDYLMWIEESVQQNN